MGLDGSIEGNVGIGTKDPITKLHVDGDVTITGDLTVDGDFTFNPEPEIGYLTVPAAAFEPRVNQVYDYENYGYRMNNLDGNSDFYCAPVYLPNGSNILNMTFYWKDHHDTDDGTVKLMEQQMNGGGGSQKLIVSTSGKFLNTQKYSYVEPSGDLIIDNKNHGYYLEVTLPSAGIYYNKVTIEYEY